MCHQEEEEEEEEEGEEEEEEEEEEEKDSQYKLKRPMAICMMCLYAFLIIFHIWL